MANITDKEENYAIVGCLFVCSGFSEIVYKDVLEYEFRLKDIPFEREKQIAVKY